MVLTSIGVEKKLELLPSTLELALHGKLHPKNDIPETPGRDACVLPAVWHPPKAGFHTKSGQARVLHDLANIELQAMELALRTLIEYPEAPEGFKAELEQVVLSEGTHLKMCLEAIEALGHRWGDWPIHLTLWRAVEREEHLLDRVFIVHRYLEGAGLDAGETLLKRIRGQGYKEMETVIDTIVREEVGHVSFGSEWYREICRRSGLDPQDDFGNRIKGVEHRLPKRLEPFAKELRKHAGFSDFEITFLGDWREIYFARPQSASSSVAKLPKALRAEEGLRDSQAPSH